MLKTERLTIKVLPAHRTALERIAGTEGESIAAIVRRLIRTEAEHRHCWPKQDLIHEPEQAGTKESGNE